MKKIYFLLIAFFVFHNLLATGTTPPDGVPCPSAGTSVNMTICDDNLATINLFGLIIAANPGGTWMRMSGNGGIFDAVAGTFIPTPGTTSSSFMYTITGTPPCPSDSSVVTITINQKPTAGILTGNQNICVGFTTTLTSTNPGGAWSSSNPAVATVHPVTGVVTGNNAGNATITYTVPGTAPCPNVTATRIVTVNAQLNPGVLSGNQNLCVGETATYTSTTLGGTWSSSHNNVATVSASGLVTAISSGSAIISYTVSGSNGCTTAMVTSIVTVQPLVTLTLNSAPSTLNQTVCVNTPIEPIVFTASNGATSATVNNLPPGVTAIFSSGILTISGTPVIVGSFAFPVTTVGGCGMSDISGSIIVSDHVMASVFCDPTQVTTSPVTSVFFDWNNFASSPSFQYSYSINNGPLQSGSTNLSHYEVLGVSPGQTVQFFLTNAFGVNCFLPASASYTLLADADFNADTFSYYPNPVNNILTLSNVNPITNIEIINTLGQQVLNKAVDSKAIEVEMSGFIPGIYLVKLTSGTSAKTIKIVKD